MPKMERVKLKEKIKRRAAALDINMVGVAPVERWAQEPHQPAQLPGKKRQGEKKKYRAFGCKLNLYLLT